MFIWTPATVIAALDAGIAEVVSMFNRAHLMHWTNAPSYARNAHNAFVVAAIQTAATLNACETLNPDPTGCPFEVAVFYHDENVHMPEPCDAPTYGTTFCSDHAICACGRPMAHDGDC